MLQCCASKLLEWVSISKDVCHVAGFPDYGVQMNPAKTKLSFDMRAGGSVLPRNTYTAKDGKEFLKWCGLLINVRTLELQGDYTRYAGAQLAASLTIPLTKVSFVLSVFKHRTWPSQFACSVVYLTQPITSNSGSYLSRHKSEWYCVTGPAR